MKQLPPLDGVVSMKTPVHVVKNMGHDTEGVSHRDACVSPLKFGGTCCCQPDEAAEPARHRCGHGPRCR